MALSNQEGHRFNAEYIGTEHLILGLIKEGTGVGVQALKRLGVDLRKVRLETEKQITSLPERIPAGKLPQTPRAKKVIEYAIEECRNLNHRYVGTEHFLLGIMREHDGIAAQVLLKNLGLKIEEVREKILEILDPPKDSPPPSEAQSVPTTEETITLTKVTKHHIISVATSNEETWLLLAHEGKSVFVKSPIQFLRSEAIPNLDQSVLVIEKTFTIRPADKAEIEEINKPPPRQ